MVNEEPARPKLIGWTPMTVGVLAMALGGLWTLQGLDLVGGSMMSGITVWAIIGPVVAVLGLGLVVFGVKRRTRSKR
jgi:hypothetical protein